MSLQTITAVVCGAPNATYGYNVWTATSSSLCSIGTDKKITSPGFVNASVGANFDLHLTASSPIIDSMLGAVSGDYPDTDYDGNNRPYGIATDAGADEYTDSISPTPPPTQPPTPPPPSPTPPPSSDTPVAAYNFNEGTGTIAADSSGQ